MTAHGAYPDGWGRSSWIEGAHRIHMSAAQAVRAMASGSISHWKFDTIMAVEREQIMFRMWCPCWMSTEDRDRWVKDMGTFLVRDTIPMDNEDNT